MSSVYLTESQIHGTGVYAGRDFTPGEMILTIDDSRIVDAAHPLRPELGEYEYHCDYLANGLVVLMLSPERHINHSCDPNSYVKTIDGKRRIVALKPIRTGEEITNDYIINCHGGIVWECDCGAPRCRGTIVSSYFDLADDWQVRYLPLLDDWFVEAYRVKVDEIKRKAHG